jgi:hypothetical protein
VKNKKTFFLAFSVLFLFTFLFWQGLKYISTSTAKQPEAKEPPAVSHSPASDQSVELEKAKEVTRLFIESYVPYDRKQPNLYWEKTKPYRDSNFMTDDNRNETTRSGIQLEKTLLKGIRSIDTYQKENIANSYVEVEVEETFTGTENQTISSIVNYHVVLIQDDGTWKVKEIRFDEGRDF